MTHKQGTTVSMINKHFCHKYLQCITFSSCSLRVLVHQILCVLSSFLLQGEWAEVSLNRLWRFGKQHIQSPSTVAWNSLVLLLCYSLHFYVLKSNSLSHLGFLKMEWLKVQNKNWVPQERTMVMRIRLYCLGPLHFLILKRVRWVTRLLQLFLAPCQKFMFPY